MKIIKVLLSLILIQIIITGYTCAENRDEKPEDESQKKPERTFTLAILPFECLTEQELVKPAADALHSVFTVGFSKDENIVLVERARLNVILKEQELALTGFSDVKNAPKIGKVLSAKTLLLGSIAMHKEKLIIVASVYDVESARLVTAVKKTGTLDQVLSMATSISDEISKHILTWWKLPKNYKIESEPIANYYFLKGLNFYMSKQYDDGICSFLKAYRISSRQDRAFYLVADSFYRMDEVKHSQIMFRTFIKRFPKSKYLKEAEKKLTEVNRKVKERGLEGCFPLEVNRKQKTQKKDDKP